MYENIICHYIYMPSMNLMVAPTAFVLLAKENIEKRPLCTKCLFFEYTKGDRDGIHTKEAKENLQTILYNATQSK